MTGVVGFLTLPATPVFSAENVEAALAAEQVKQAALAKKAHALNSEVGNLQSKLVQTSKVLRETEAGLSDTNSKLSALQNRKARQVAQIYKDEETLGGFVSAVRRYSAMSAPSMLIQASPLHAARSAIVMKSILPAMEQNAGALRAQLSEIEDTEAEISAQLAEQSKEINGISKKKGELARLIEGRKGLYQETEVARKAQEKAVAQLAKEAKDLEDLVSKMQELPVRKPQTQVASAATLALPPHIQQPVGGRVLTGFGEKDELGAKSRGITFGTAAGATVVTPLDGKVKFAGAFQKHKQILIIAHEGGYHSLIAGLGRIDTVVGAKLAAGEPVGAADAGVSEARVYYELRQDGTPVNPRNLQVAQRKQSRS